MKYLFILLFPIVCQAQVVTNSYRHYCEEYKAVLLEGKAQGWAPPTDLEKRKDNNVIVYWKANGIWSKFDVFYGMTGNANFATINWVNPTGTKLSLTGALTYSATNGWTGDGTNYITTGWVPNSSSKFTQNSGSIGWGITAGTSTAGLSDWGTGNDGSLTNGANVNSRNAGNQMVLRINQTTSASPTNATVTGRFIMQRSASNAWQVYRNGSSLATGSNASTGRSTFEMYILAANGGGTASGHSTRTLNYFFAGEVMTGLEATLDAGLLTFR